MSSYIGRHAALYDLFYAEKQYQSEVARLHDLLQQYGNGTVKKVLELACGTGNHALLLSKLGYEIIATDYSEDMIIQARTKNKGNTNPVFNVRDMLELDDVETFDAIICLFDSIGYVQTNASINKVLQNIQKALKPGGIFIFEFWHAAAMIKSFDPLRVKYFKTDTQTIQRISETSINYATQVCTVKYTIHEFDRTKQTYSLLTEEQKNRFFLLQEMRFFVEQNNFDLMASFDGYSSKKNIDENTWHVLSVCKKR